MTAPQHSERAHSTWSASASEANFNCPGRLALLSTLDYEDKESHAAAWGTACHQVSERCFATGKDAIDFLGEVERTKSFEIEVDEELAETAQVYVDYVRGRVAENPDSRLVIEQRFSLADLDPPFDAGGMGDAVILSAEAKTIEVVDLKGGRGIVVDAKGNKQLRTYGLGALMSNPGPWRTIRVTIVQPRADHPDGRIRSEEFHVADLMDWTQDLMEAMHRSAQAMADQNRLANWAETYLRAGDHCTFCPAAPTCPALASRSLEIAQTYFDDERQAMAAPPAPETLPIEKIVQILDHADMIQNWLNAVRAYAQDQAESGIEISDGTSTYVLTAKRATRKWKEGFDVLDLGMATGRDTAEFYQEPKLMSPAQVEKLLGKKDFEAVADLVVKESSGFNLTRADKTSRAAVIPPAKQFFQPE